MKLKKEIEKIIRDTTEEYEFLADYKPIQPRTSAHRLFGEELVDKLTSLFLSTFSGLKAMEEEKQQSYNPDVNISQAGRNQLRQQILKELKAELKEK